MKKRILPFLACPSCGGDLRLKIDSVSDDRIKDGKLLCGCTMVYPIVNFIPRLLPQDIENSQKQVQRSFTHKWKSQPKWGFTAATQKFMREWIIKKYGWNSERSFKEYISSKKMILDAGTGG